MTGELTRFLSVFVGNIWESARITYKFCSLRNILQTFLQMMVESIW